MPKSPNQPVGATRSGRQAGGVRWSNAALRWVAAAGVLVAVAVLVAVVSTGGASGGGDSGAFSVSVSKSVRVTGQELAAAPKQSGLADPSSDPAVGSVIPTVDATSMGGEDVTLSPGRPTVVVFVAHWCGHCQKEVPLLVEWTDAGAVPAEVDFVAVSSRVDKNANNFPPTKWLSREGWQGMVIADDAASSVLGAYGGSGFPYFVAVDGDGKVVQRASGELTRAEFDELIASVTP